MENLERITLEVKDSFCELERFANAAKDQLRKILKGHSKARMIAEINKLQLSDRCINLLCEGQVFDAQDYEICLAVREIKKELIALEINQASYSPTLYYYSKDECRTSYLYQEFD